MAADSGAAGDADLRAEDGMLADGHIVADLDEVIDFRASLNPGATKSGAVDGGIGSDLNIVVDLDGAGLRDFVLAAFAEFVAEAVGSDDDSRVDDDAVADAAALAHRHAMVQVAILPDHGFLAHHGVRGEDGAGTQNGVFFHHAIGPDGASLADPGRFVDDGTGMDAGLVFQRLGREEREERGESFGRILDMQAVGAEIFGELLGNEDGGGARLAERDDVFRISEKRKIAGIGIGQRGDAGDFDIGGLGGEPGVHTPGQLVEFHYCAETLPASLFSASTMDLLKSRSARE